MNAAMIVPPITNALGAGWRQPPREEIEIDDRHVLMSRRTLEALSEYSYSRPSGVYEGILIAD